MEKKHERSPLTKSMNYKSLNEDILYIYFAMTGSAYEKCFFNLKPTQTKTHNLQFNGSIHVYNILSNGEF